LSRILTVAANTVRETVRERVLYNLVFFAVLMMVAGLLVRELSIRQDEKIIKEIGLAAMDAFGTLIAVFIGVGLVSKEIERRSLFPLLAKPLSREEFYVGKFLGLSATLLVNVAVMSLGLLLTLLATGVGPDLGLFRAIGPLCLGLLLVVAFAMMFSTFTSSALAAVCTVGVVVAGRYADVVRNMKEVAPGIPTVLIDALYYAVPNFQNFDFKSRVVYGDPVPPDALLFVALYGALYIALVLAVGLLGFRSRDFQ
jgi:ABC-type transport system involved in multi-copper enzyme maturation permease subunit